MASKAAAASKRQSSVSVPSARPACDVHATALIADKASLSGTHEIQVGENSVLHPYSKLRAEHCRIVIGAQCTVAEAAVIGLAGGPAHSDSSIIAEIRLEDGVCIDSGAQVMAARIGEGSDVGIQAVVGRGAVIGKFCKIAPKQHIADGEHLDDFTVLLGDGTRRRNITMSSHETMRQARVKGQAQHVETLRKLMPNAASKWTSLS